jgi:hypothetical protein
MDAAGLVATTLIGKFFLTSLIVQIVSIEGRFRPTTPQFADMVKKNMVCLDRSVFRVYESTVYFRPGCRSRPASSGASWLTVIGTG